MTIAAGFALHDGILLCSDSLITDGITKQYGQKVFHWGGGYASVGFAIAGHPTVANIAVDECKAALDTMRDEPLSTTKILGVIRPIINEVNVEYVDTRPAEDRNPFRFDLLVAIVTQDEFPALYATNGAPLGGVRHFDCIGSGRHLGRYIAEQFSFDTLVVTVDDASVAAIQLLTAAKDRVDGVDGPSQFLVVRNRVTDQLPHDPVASETCVRDYQHACGQLLLGIANRPDQDFRERLDRFIRSAEDIRQRWLTYAAPFRASRSESPTNSSTDHT